MADYIEFKKVIYQDMINEWKKIRISYILDNKYIDELKTKDPSITLEKIMIDFAKYPLVKDVYVDNGMIIVMPK